MRISRTLKISSFVSMACFAVVVLIIFRLQELDANHAATTIHLNEAVRKIAHIRGNIAELSGPFRQRATRQWQVQFAELTPILTAIPTPLDRRAQGLKVRVLEDQLALGVLFEKVLSLKQGTAGIENMESLIDQLSVRTASMVSDVLAINDITAAQINREKRWGHGLLVVVIAVFAAVVIGLLYIFHRRVVIPIGKLEKATTALRAGSFNQPVYIAGNDEIAALATGFEYMRIALDESRKIIRDDNDHLAQRVEERTAELKAANLELDSFAYAVSHDLRAPLRAISGFSQALMEDMGDQLSADARVDLEQINIASLRMGELIEGLLVLSRSTRAEMRHDPINLSAMAEGIWRELLLTDPERQISCAIEPGMNARGDPRMIEAALRNLLENAWKYTQRALQPAIRFYAEQTAGIQYYCVADNGAGFDMAHAGRLFQPFQRLHRQEEFPGTGIGLATVSRIVQRHGGTMRAEGVPGNGATICFSLPAAILTGRESS